MTRTTQVFALLVAPSLLGACVQASDDDAASSTAAVPGAECRLEEVERTPLTRPDRDGVTAYVEPQGLVPTPNGFFLVGQPTYEWSFDAEGRSLMRSSGGFLGVERRGEDLTSIPFPAGVGDVGWVSAASLGPERMGVLLEEVEGPTPTDTRTARVLYAEYSAGSWSQPEPLPLPGEGSVMWNSESSVGASPDGRVYWATPFAGPRGGVDVLVVEREADRWHTTAGARRWADEAALAENPAGELVLAVAGLDTTRAEQVRSIRIARRAGGSAVTWSSPETLQSGRPGQAFQALTFVRTHAGVDLAWIRTAAAEGPSELWVVQDAGTTGQTAPLLLDPNVALVRRVDAGADAWLLTLHLGVLPGAQELRIHRRETGGYRVVSTIPYPFQGPFAATTTATGDLLVIGPEASLDPVNPFVRSLVIRLSGSCT